MSKNPSVTVIILNYNGRDLMEECVAAVLKSSYKNLDILIIDNASTDGSVEYLNKKYGRNSKIKIISSKVNTFFAGGFNLGAKKASGDLIVLLSNDVIVEKTSIEELVKGMKDEKQIVQPKILSYWDKISFDNAGGFYSWYGVGHARGAGETDQGQYDEDADCGYASATTFMINRKFFLSLGGYDEWFRSHYEDVDLALRAKKAGGSCRYCHKSVMYHKISVTYKKYVKSEQLLYDIRKNRLRTVTKNFKGVRMLARIIAMIPMYIANIVTDILSMKPSIMMVTVRAVSAAIKQ